MEKITSHGLVFLFPFSRQSMAISPHLLNSLLPPFRSPFDQGEPGILGFSLRSLPFKLPFCPGDDRDETLH